MADKPLIQFEDAAAAPILRYDIPTPSSYEGRAYVEITLPPELFTAAATKPPLTYLDDFFVQNQESIGEYLSNTTREEFERQLCSYALDKAVAASEAPHGAPIFARKVAVKKEDNKRAKLMTTKIDLGSEFNKVLGSGKLNSGLSDLLQKRKEEKGDDSLVMRYELFRLRTHAALEDDGMFPTLYRTLSGKLKLRFVPIPKQPVPRLVFVETHRLTTFPGDYGAGLTVQTFSLLPGEETTISVKTWKKSTSAISEASSILDSYTDERADEFEQGVQAEQSSSSKAQESFSYHAEAKASGSWGTGSAEVSGGVAGSSNSAREEAAKNVMNATDKHAQKASAKREVNVETSFSKTQDQGQEQTIERRIRNVNVSRTLNFAFRQLNQEFHSALHLTDVRIAFYNGVPGSMREYSLYELRQLVGDFMVQDFDSNAVSLTVDPANVTNGRVKTVSYLRQIVLDEYRSVRDHEGVMQKLVEQVDIPAPQNQNWRKVDSYLRIIPFKNASGAAGGQDFIVRPGNKPETRRVPGIVLAIRKFVMRTAGVIVESLLGHAEALDSYALGTQKAVLKQRQLENDRLAAALAVVNGVAANAKAEAFAKVFPAPVLPSQLNGQATET